MVLGPGTVNCLQGDDFSACMGETFFGNGLTPAIEAGPSEEVAVAQADQEPAATEPVAVADAEQPAGSDESATSVSEAVLPSFGLVRVEPDGSAVIAGTVSPSGEVRIFADEEHIGTETAEPTGDFAFITDDPLPPGGVELRILDVETDTYAEESVVVVVQDDLTGEPIVVASEPGEASQILQGLEQPQATAQAEAPESRTATSVGEPETMDVAVADVPAASTVPAESTPDVQQAPPQSTAPTPTEAAAEPLSAQPAPEPGSPQVAPQSTAPAPAEPATETPGTPAGETAAAAAPQPTPGGVTPQVEMPSPAEMTDDAAPAAPAPAAPVAPMAADAPEPASEDTAQQDAPSQAPGAPAPQSETPTEISRPADAAEPADDVELEPQTSPAEAPIEPVDAAPEQSAPAPAAPVSQAAGQQPAEDRTPDQEAIEQPAPQEPSPQEPAPVDQPSDEPAGEQQVAELPAAEQSSPAPQEPVSTAQPDFIQPSIDAVEIDGDRNFFAGAGTDGMIVRLYVDNEVVGTTEVADGRWLVEAIGILDQESQRVRIDMLAEDGTVVGRAEVDFVLDLPEAVQEDLAVAEQEDQTVQPDQQPDAEEPTAQEQAVENATIEEPAVAEPSDQPAAEEPAEQAVEQPAPRGPAAADTEVADQTASPPADIAPEPAEPTLAPAEPAEAPAEVSEPSAEEVPTLVGVTDEAGRVTSGLAIIRSGDNLWTIARRVYGQGIRYTQIFEANTDQIRDPDLIYPGQVFDLPDTDQVVGEEETENADVQ